MTYWLIPSREEVVAHAREQFAFLSAAGGRRQPQTIERAYHTNLGYLLVPLSYEVCLDFRDQDASVRVHHTIDIHRPSRYHLRGRGLGLYLFTVFRRCHGPEWDTSALLPVRRTPPGKAEMIEELSLNAEALRGSFEKLPAYVDRLFPRRPD